MYTYALFMHYNLILMHTSIYLRIFMHTYTLLMYTYAYQSNVYHHNTLLIHNLSTTYPHYPQYNTIIL